MEPIGQRVKRVREEKELSQKEVVIDGGLKQSYLSNLERGNIKEPTLEMLKKVAKGLRVTLDELLIGTNCEGLFKLPAEMVYCPNPRCLKAGTADENGIKILTKRFYTERFKENGKEVKYCPYCGEEIIHRCPEPECGTPIYQWDALFCMGCGKELFKLTEDEKKK